MCVARHAQIILQNNNFAISLQYFKKKASDEVDFLHTDKHESFLQVDGMIFWWGKIKQSQSSQCLYNISRRKVRDKIDFFHADKHHSFVQVFFTTLGIKISYKVILSLLIGMIKPFKVLKVLSLQYLYNISKKKLGMEFFCMQININVGIIVFDDSDMSRHVQSTQNRKLVIFIQYIKKKSIATVFVFYCDARHWDILQGSSHVCCYLFCL